MDTSVISIDDMNYLAQQSAGNLNMILLGMTTLIDDNDSKVSMLENQTWYQRMSRTILGKNKMTQKEIQQNHDKINMYMSQAMTELFNQNSIDHQIILSLGNRLNEIYADHIQLKQMLGAFVSKLNEKIESIDNFHMLTTEINQGVYSNYMPVIAISKIMSQIDVRTVKDSRKMDILVRAMRDAGIVNSGEVYFTSLLCDLLEVSEKDAGIFSLFYSNIRDEYMSEIIADTMMEYYLLPQKVRKMKKRQAFVEKILSDRQIDLKYKISLEELYLSLIEAYGDSIVKFAIEKKEYEIYRKYLKYQDYCSNITGFLKKLCYMINSWNPNHGEFLNDETIIEYTVFINNVREALDPDSPMGRNLKNNVCNVSFFFQKLVAMYPSIGIFKIHEHDINNNGAINFGAVDEEYDEYNESYSWNEYDKYYSFWLCVDEYRILLTEELPKDYFCLDKMLERINSGPYDVISFNSFQIKCFVEYYGILYENIENMIGDNYSDFEEIYDLIEYYPIDFSEEDYDEIFVWEIDYDRPYMVLANSADEVIAESDEVGYFSLGMTKEDLFQNAWLGVFNYFGKYTIKMEIIENSCLSESYEEERAFDIEFGEWNDAGVLEIYISKLNWWDCKFHSAKVKFYLKEEPLCAALLDIF